MVKYWFLSGQGLPARARSFVGVMQDTLCPGPNQSFWQQAPKRKEEGGGKKKKSELVKLRRKHPRSGLTGLQSRERQTEACRYLQHWLHLIWILMMCLLSGNAQQITADGITVGAPWAGNEDLGERVYILFKQLSARAARESQVMCCVTTQWSFPPAGAITDLLMGSHQSQSASYSTSVSTLLSTVTGSWNRGNNGVLWLLHSRSHSRSTSRSHISSQSNSCFAMSACLLIREPQNGHERQLKPGRGLGPLGERRINVKLVSGGMSVLAVWCQKQLIGFSLHSVQSTVTSTEHRLQTKDERMNAEMNEHDCSCVYFTHTHTHTVFHVFLCISSMKV